MSDVNIFSRMPKFDERELDEIFKDDILVAILSQYSLNESKSTRLYSKYSSETKTLREMNREMPFWINDSVTNLSLGRFYDVYLVRGSVLKIQRINTIAKFPGSELNPDLKKSVYEHITKIQSFIFDKLRGCSNLEDAVVRSLSNQRFYYDILPKAIDKEHFVTTDFVLLVIDKVVYEIQVQEYVNGPTLMKCLRTHPAWGLLLSRWKLKSMYRPYLRWIIRDIDSFCDIPHLDHRPDNFIVDVQNKRLILVDIQQMDLQTEKYNQYVLQQVRESINWKLNPYAMEFKPRYPIDRDG